MKEGVLTLLKSRGGLRMLGLPGGPPVKSLHFQLREARVPIPGQRSKIPRAARCGQKQTNKKKDLPMPNTYPFSQKEKRVCSHASGILHEQQLHSNL